MKTDEKVETALSSMGLPVVKWFDYENYEDGFPVLSYKLISAVPVNFGDDREVSTNYTYQVSLITENDETDSIIKQIRDAMYNQGFSFVSCDEIRDEKENFITAIRFYINESEE
jgi:hypothetical protein